MELDLAESERKLPSAATATTGSDASTAAGITFKKRSLFNRRAPAKHQQHQQQRSKRCNDSSSGSDSDELRQETVVFKKAKSKSVGLTQSTSSVGVGGGGGGDDGAARRNARKFAAAAASDNDESSASSGDELKKKDSGKMTFGVVIKGTGSQQARDNQNATATYEFDTAHDRDGRALFERAKKTNADVRATGDLAADNVYRGKANYSNFLEKKDTWAGSAHKNSVGPQRAPANIRATVRWDYEPALCKDFKETGFCGFGDTCKFMHDRTDYKFGWQIERDLEAGVGEEDVHKYEVSSDEDDLPFKCVICRESFTRPVVTKCKHYFCEKCALDHYRKSQRCYACGAQTSGTFNTAKEIIAKLEKHERSAKAAAAAARDDDDAQDDGGRKDSDAPPQNDSDTA